MTKQVIFDDGSEKGAWLTVCNKPYDVAIAEDHYGAHGRLHHISYAVDSREDVLRAADICLDNGAFIETAPHKHAIQQTFFLSMYEPGGNRFEVANAGARLVLAPNWKPVVCEVRPNARRGKLGVCRPLRRSTSTGRRWWRNRGPCRGVFRVAPDARIYGQPRIRRATPSGAAAR